MWVDIFAYCVMFLFGYALGVCSMAGMTCSGKEKAVNDAYRLGYEMGRKAEQEKKKAS